MQQIIQEIARNVELQNPRKIPSSELYELIQQYNVKELESLIKEDEEYTYEQLYSAITGQTVMNSLQFISKDSIITRNENLQFISYKVQLDQQDFDDLMKERFSMGFLFDPKECFFAHPDMFQFITLCQEEIKLNQSSAGNAQISKPIRGGMIRSQQDIQPISQQQKQKEHSILDGIFIKGSSQPIEKDYLDYKYYTNEQIKKLIIRCGWKSGDTYPFLLHDICQSYLLTNQYSRAAAVACVHFDFHKAIEILQKGAKTQETYWILMALQGMQEATHDCLVNGLKEVAKKAIEMPKKFLETIKFTDPYFELIAEFIKKDKFIEYLNYGTSKISIFDRVGLWARFCQGKIPIISNLLDNIILNGRCEQSVEFLQQYVDDKNDIQLSGVIACHLAILDYPRKDILLKIFQAYIEYLISLDYQIGELLCKIKQTEVEYQKSFLSDAMRSYLQPQISMICSFCLNPLGQPYLELQRKMNPRRGNLARDDNPRTTLCSHCNHNISNCVVCAQYFTLPNNLEIDRKRGSNQQRILDTLKIDQAMVWCLSCKHGGHQQHIEEWFELYSKCPACDCECSII